MTGRSLLAATAALLLLTGTPVPVAAQPSSARAPRIIEASAMRSEVGGPAYVGILGEVAQPGTYSFRGERLVLGDVLARAGGTTDRASGTIRVIRNGRAGQQLHRATSLDFPLLAGDLLVVDGRSRAGRIEPARATGSPTTNASSDMQSGTAEVIRGSGRSADRRAAADEASSAPVQLAFLHLLDRPVVLKMRVEHATLMRIAALLGQSPEVVSTVRVIETGPTRALAGTDEPENVALLSGTILVFDPRTIDRSRLPDLPGPDLAPASAHVGLAPAPTPAPFRPVDPVPVQVAADVTPASSPVIATTAERPPIPRALAVVPPNGGPRIIGPVPQTASRIPAASPTRTPHATSTPHAAPSAGEPPTSNAVLLRMPTSDADALRTMQPTAGVVAPHSEPLRGSDILPQPPGREPAAVSFPTPASPVPPLPTPSPTEPAPESDAEARGSVPARADRETAAVRGAPPAGSGARMAGLAVAIVAALWGLAWSMLRSGTSTPAIGVRRGALDPLDDLIADRVPVVEEALVLPERISFYGRPATLRRLRIDAAHDTPAPNVREAVPAMPGSSARSGPVRSAAPVRPETAASRDVGIGARVDVGVGEAPPAAHGIDDSPNVLLEDLLAETVDEAGTMPESVPQTESTAKPAPSRRRAPRGPHFLGRTRREALSILEAAFASAESSDQSAGERAAESVQAGRSVRPTRRGRGASTTPNAAEASTATALEHALTLLQSVRGQRAGKGPDAAGEGRS